MVSMYNWIVTRCKIQWYDEKTVTTDIQLAGILSTVKKSGFSFYSISDGK